MVVTELVSEGGIGIQVELRLLNFKYGWQKFSLSLNIVRPSIEVLVFIQKRQKRREFSYQQTLLTRCHSTVSK